MEPTIKPPSKSEACKSHCTMSNTKEKTPMCLVNELARYNQKPHQYRLTHEDGPAHMKVFTVTLKLGDEEYQADGSSIKKAQHSAASLALKSTEYKHPPAKTDKTTILRRNITPTVELNALSMKIGEVTEYKYVQVPTHVQVQTPQEFQHYYKFRSRGRGMRGSFRPFRGGFYRHMGYSTDQNEMFKVSLKVGSREYTGTGVTPQIARHDAATKALNDLRESIKNEESKESNGDGIDQCTVCPPSERKSPVSLVHEIALKREWEVSFEVVEEKGLPHMRLYYTKCKVGDIVTIGEGNGKKISKGKAAELMLEELNKLPPISETQKPKFKRRQFHSNMKGKRKVRNTKHDEFTENIPPSVEKFDGKYDVCPIELLKQYQISRNLPEQIYKVIETKVIPNTKKKEFTMQLTLGDYTVIAISSNKKSAMKNAAHLMLVNLGESAPREPKNQKKITKKPAKSERKSTSKKEKTNVLEIQVSTENNESFNGTGSDTPVKSENHQIDSTTTNSFSGATGGRQLVPGMILMSQSQPTAKTPKTPQPLNRNVDIEKTVKIAKEYLSQGSSPTAEALNRRRKNKKQPIIQVSLSNPKDQLIYLSQISGFQIQYSDFPNPNSQTGPGDESVQGFLSLVSLSTSPPQVCHGVGATIEQSQNDAAVSALKFISEMNLHSITPLATPSTPVSHKSCVNERLFPSGTSPITPVSFTAHPIKQEQSSK